MTLEQTPDWIIYGGSVATALTAIWAFKPAKLLVLKAMRVVSFLFRGPFVIYDKIQSLEKSIVKLDTTVQGILYQVKPNGSGSMNDAVARTEKSVKSISVELAELKQRNKHNFWARPCPVMEMDRHGRATHVSAALCRLFKVDRERECQGVSYRQFLDSEEVERFNESFREIATESGHFRFQTKIFDSSREDRGTWEIKAIPLQIEDRVIYTAMLYPIDTRAKQIWEDHHWSGA